jgi:hypothetical protein
MAAPFTIFGYGSLIFKVTLLSNRPPRQSLPSKVAPSSHPQTRFFTADHLLNLNLIPRPLVHGFLKGYVRRFAQSSHDHRGTDEVSNQAVTS